uniref:Uncharacterized protein n=1 Tax=Anguilla anguilla TaxID=7936 RepID=A0A0E9XMG4_ANGAN
MASVLEQRSKRRDSPVLRDHPRFSPRKIKSTMAPKHRKAIPFQTIKAIFFSTLTERAS